VKKRCLAVLLALCSVLASKTASAQQAAYGLEHKAVSERLAKQALACLERGENATEKSQKIAAYREGLDLARRAVQSDETNADAHFALFANNGRLLLLNGIVPNPVNLLHANAELEKTLELNPNHTDALAARGGLYRQLPRLLGGNLDKAEADLTRSIQLNPGAVLARIELARTYFDKGKPENVRPLLTEAIKLAEEQKRRRELEEARQLLAELEADSR
jgi:hypothetical protein